MSVYYKPVTSPFRSRTVFHVYEKVPGGLIPVRNADGTAKIVDRKP